MRLILTHEVTGLGAPGDVVDVKDGYGRNYLMPRAFAVPWTTGGEKQVATITRARARREVRSLDEARAVKARLESRPVRLVAKAGASGRLFGAITPADVAAAVSAGGGPDVDRRKVEIGQAIKTLGTYQATVRLHPEVSATVGVEVVAS